MTTEQIPRPAEREPRWRPLAARDRRVLGVLVEKAKTTPEAYPMSVNALRAGCNQKNNRYPLMELEAEDVEESLARLREAGAAAEVQGGGRVLRYRHYFYEWLGVDKVESAVMTELLLRGAQTEGELRGRAARMEPIADVAALRPVLASLKSKGLVISLTSDGRGHVVTHALYEPRELEKLQAEYSGGQPPAREPAPAGPERDSPERASDVDSEPARPVPPAQPGPAAVSSAATDVAELKRQLEGLRGEVAQLRKDLEDLWANFR
jgi:uncharacterized protein YceH (UPF0502 family)